MIPYLLPFLTLTALTSGLTLRQRNQFYWFILSTTFVFVAFRYQVGCDWTGYLHQFSIAGGTFFDPWSMSEPLWWWLIQKIEGTGLDYVWINVASALFFFAGVHLLARRQPDPAMFLLLLFPILMVNIAMSGLRQAIAIGFLCAALVAFNDRRLLLFLALIGIGAQFHASLMVFLLLAPLVSGRYSKRRLILAGLLAIPGAIALSQSDAGELAASRYIDTGIDAYGAIFRVGFLGLSGIIFFRFVSPYWARAFPNDYKLALVGALMMLGAFAILPVSTVIADRLAYYLVPIQAIIFARLQYLPFPRKLRSWILPLPWVGLLVIFVAWLLVSKHFNVCYTPYRTWVFG